MKKFIIILLSLLVSSCGALSLISTAKTIITTDLDRRTIGAITDDELTDLELEAWAINDEKLTNSHINFHIYNKQLLMTGEVESNEVKKYLIEKIRGKGKIDKIFDETKIENTTSFISRGQDSLIDGKIKIAINSQEVFNPVHIYYHTENRIVYLMGDVTKREGKKAGIMVADISGVKGVVKYFNYIDKIPQKEIDRAVAKEVSEKKLEFQRNKDFEKKQRIDKLNKQIEAINNE
jgi:osmotically-inducible protein OsmY